MSNKAFQLTAREHASQVILPPGWMLMEKTMNRIQLILASLLLLVGACVASCQSIGDSIAESHVRANVPEEKDFDSFLKRDLESYFKDLKKKNIVVEYQLLRDGPTQSGIAFPKFYCWVTIKENGVIVEDGAVRVAAMEKKRFGFMII
jgi:hypothetical protein